ncbi:MAG: exodeoxyribonuclease III [Candidatus Eremiobacteraeota bacterium]|nr:exodeoxyribonuclease III [Candidatus Eremiobacteraeota bacterium]
MRVTTFNANGIRAAARKGFFTWLRSTSPDVLCIQETKAQEHQLPPEALDLSEYTYAFVDAQKKGYSGVAIYAKRAPERIVRGFGMPDMDAEGRYVRFDWDATSIASIYVPSGTSGEARQSVKESFLERFLAQLAEQRGDGRRYILCGDFNIAHRDIDTFDPVANSRVTGFLPQERAWMDSVVEHVGWVDAFREVDREAKRYTWWSNWPGAFERNLGWRIDYQLVTPDLAAFVRSASIYRDERFSDHAPLTINYDIEL